MVYGASSGLYGAKDWLYASSACLYDAHSLLYEGESILYVPLTGLQGVQSESDQSHGLNIEVHRFLKFDVNTFRKCSIQFALNESSLELKN